MNSVNQSPLGKTSEYVDRYSPDLLFPIPRVGKREEIGVPSSLPFHGCDIWNGYELSWLNLKGKPQITTAQFRFPCETPKIIESKSFKLYLNSFNQSKFESESEVRELLVQDLSAASGGEVRVKFGTVLAGEFTGECLDSLDIEVDCYQVNPKLLQVSDELVEEELFTHLLKSNCLVTGQPDWGSVWIQYSGPQICHESLLRYIISFRQHNEFHEQCVERIFMDLMRECGPEKLTVHGKYTRRGGLDINPYRSNCNVLESDFRLSRQ